MQGVTGIYLNSYTHGDFVCLQFIHNALVLKNEGRTSNIMSVKVMPIKEYGWTDLQNQIQLRMFTEGNNYVFCYLLHYVVLDSGTSQKTHLLHDILLPLLLISSWLPEQ